MAEAKAAVKANGAKEEKGLPPIRPDRCYCAEQKTQSLLIYAPAGIASEDIGKPEIWQALSHMLQPYSVAWVIADDESWAAEVLVRSNLPGRCSVIVLRTLDMPAFDYGATRTLPDGISVVHKGSALGWVVTRTNADGSETVMGTGKEHPEWFDEETVIRWVLDHASVRQIPSGPRRFAA